MTGYINFIFSIFLCAITGLNDAPFDNEKINYQSHKNEAKTPDSTRFTPINLVAGLDEPMGMAILPNYDVIIIERKGAIKRFDNATKQIKTIANLKVYSGIEDGLLGIAADPNFQENNWLYLYYGVAGEENVSHLARYDLKEDQLNIASKKVLLKVPTQRTYCCHSAGYLTFDADGLLYLATGDNTNAEEIEGHNPTDERPGRELSDDQGTSANSKDYRGKILRIKPENDGSYSIPEGNLFSKDGSQGYPEIYVMGCRNPFRVSVDPKTKYVYWGDVGPDTNIPAEEGFLSYDEINQAKKPGFFGYPYFLGNNEGFPKYDFETKKEGPKQDPALPINVSPNNTGIKNLPPAQPAMIWYGKGPSKRWPLVGKGAASAMAGPVFYSDQYRNAPYKLPEYYNGKLFIYEWVRKWIMAVTFDEKGNYKSMEPFLPHLKVVAPIDFQIAADGAIYILAYGTNWFAQNADAGLIRIEYSEGNRKPVAVISSDKSVGGIPADVHFSASKSIDYDIGDKLRFEWRVDGKVFNQKEIDYQFKKAGNYTVVLIVSDQHGGVSTTTQEIKVGNTPPIVSIDSKNNKSFYWDNQVFPYHISISDREDKTIDPKRFSATFTYLQNGKDIAAALSGAVHGNLKYAETEQMFLSLDCKTCHAFNTKSIGPSLKAIANKYKNSQTVVNQLSAKVLKGGSGVWGSYPMPPHLDLAETDSKKIIQYILSLSDNQEAFPFSGVIDLNEHKSTEVNGAYVFQAKYTDTGANGIEPLTTGQYLVLRNPVIELEDFEEGNVNVSIGTLNNGYITSIPCGHNKFVSFKNIDLRQIQKITFRLQKNGSGGTLDIRKGSRNGPIIGSIRIEDGVQKVIKNGWQDISIPIKPVEGNSDLFITFTNSDLKANTLFYLDWMRFER